MRRRAHRPVYVAVGASDSVGVGATRPGREAWPRVLHRTVLEPHTRFVNLAVSGATVADALRRQVPRAETLRPALVTVWLAVNDLVAGVPADEYEAGLSEVVGRLRAAGAGRILVGNVPYLDRMPVYVAYREAALTGPGGAGGVWVPSPSELNGAVDRYNAGVERVVRTHVAELVDLRVAGLAVRQAGREAELFSGDGFHPSTVGHRAIASVFGDVVRRR